MDSRKPAKSAAPVATGKEDTSKKETKTEVFPHPDAVQNLRSDQQELCTALQEQPDSSDAIERGLYHLDTLDQFVIAGLRNTGVQEAALQRICVWHDLARILLVDLMSDQQDGESGEAKRGVLVQLLQASLDEEGTPDSGIFALIASAKTDLSDIATQIETRKVAFQKQAKTGNAPTLSILRLDALHRQTNIPSEGYAMARNQNDRPRDEEGRFTSGSYGSGRDDRDDDRRSEGRGSGWYGDSRGHSQAARQGWEHRDDGRRSSGRDDDDDRRYSRGGGSNDRPRDDQGRFMSDDDRSGSRGGRYDDDDRRYSRGSGSSDRSRDDQGRFASDDDRGGSRSRRNDDDDDRYSSRGRDNDSYRGDNDRGDGRGWYGDSRGHAQAARRGWEHRDDRSGSSRDDDDDRRYGRGGGSNDRLRDDQGRFMSDDDRGGSRSRRGDDDDDRYSSRGRDNDDDRRHGGWFGDPRGHSEAARRGREGRR